MEGMRSGRQTVERVSGMAERKATLHTIVLIITSVYADVFVRM